MQRRVAFSITVRTRPWHYVVLCPRLAESVLSPKGDDGFRRLPRVRLRAIRGGPRTLRRRSGAQISSQLRLRLKLPETRLGRLLPVTRPESKRGHGSFGGVVLVSNGFGRGV